MKSPCTLIPWQILKVLLETRNSSQHYLTDTYCSLFLEYKHYLLTKVQGAGKFWIPIDDHLHHTVRGTSTQTQYLFYDHKRVKEQLQINLFQ
jgi:hypothetical protein